MPSVSRRLCAGACDIALADPVGDSHADAVEHSVTGDFAIPEQVSQQNEHRISHCDAVAAADVKLFAYYDAIAHRD